MNKFEFTMQTDIISATSRAQRTVLTCQQSEITVNGSRFGNS